VPTDVFAHPSSLILLPAALLMSWLIWRGLLAGHYHKLGIAPLLVAYLCALAGLVVGSFWSANDIFSARVIKEALVETQRWSFVPGWTRYQLFFSLIFVLPMLVFICTPAAAWLAKSNRLTFWNIAATFIAFWVASATLLWAFAAIVNRALNPEWFFPILLDAFPHVGLVTLPFLLGFYWLASRRQRTAVA
jgi:hypothetical protein